MAEVENVVQAASPAADAQPGMQPAPLTLDHNGEPISARVLQVMEPSDFLAAYLRSMAAGALPPAQVRAAVEAIRAVADAAERLDEVLRRASMPCTDADGNLTRGLLPEEEKENLIAPSSSSSRLLAPRYCPRCDDKYVSEPAAGDAGAEGDDENRAEESGEPAGALPVYRRSGGDDENRAEESGEPA